MEEHIHVSRNIRNISKQLETDLQHMRQTRRTGALSSKKCLIRLLSLLPTKISGGGKSSKFPLFEKSHLKTRLVLKWNMNQLRSYVSGLTSSSNLCGEGIKGLCLKGKEHREFRETVCSLKILTFEKKTNENPSFRCWLSILGYMPCRSNWLGVEFFIPK